MQRILATVIAVVFVFSGFGVSLAGPKGQDRKGGQEAERDKDKHKGGDEEKDKDKDDQDDDKDGDGKGKVHKEREDDRKSGKQSDRKHGLDRANQVAGEHGKKGRDNAREHQD